MDSESADSSSQPQTNDMKSHSMANNVEPPVKAYDIERPKGDDNASTVTVKIISSTEHPPPPSDLPSRTSAFARFTSGLGLRLQSMNLPPDNHAEPTSTGTQTVLESFKKGIADSSCSEGCAGQNTPYGFPKQKKIPGILTVLFMEGEFDLDMTYITENIIAMGFPAGDLSSGLLGFFEGKVASFPFNDHNCPPLHLIKSFCQSAYSWVNDLQSFLFLKFYPTAEEVIDYFNQKRCIDGKALVLPSQIRYVKYFKRMATCFHGENRPGRASGFTSVLIGLGPPLPYLITVPEDFWIKTPKKGIVIFALPREPGLAEVAGDFKIHFHDHQGYFYWSATFLFSVTAVEQLSQVKLNSPILQDSIVKQVNENPKAGWKAALNPRFSNYTVAEFKNILGVKPTPKEELMSIPVGHCGSCWAFGAVEALTDRFCTHFGQNIPLSVNDVLACCDNCGGCDGGISITAWRYFVSNGVVTEKCDPYFDPIGCSHPGCEPIYPTPKCVKKCVKGDLLWKESKHYSVDAYLVKWHPADIMAEVYKNGPVQVSFLVYEDFAHYKSGVYKHVTGEVLGGHSVKLIGWGTSDEGEDYWLLANQWNRNWGDDGFFKIRRGVDECRIEDEVVAGLPSNKHRILQRRSEYCRMDSESADSSSQPQTKASDVETSAEVDTDVKQPANTNDMKSHSMANNVEPPVKAYDTEPPKADDNASTVTVKTISSTDPAPSDLPSTGMSSWARKFKLPQPVAPPQASQAGNAGTSAFARFTSGLGLRLQSMNPPPDNHAEPTSTGTQTVLESFKKGIVDSSLSAVKAVQVKTHHMVSQNKRRYQGLPSSSVLIGLSPPLPYLITVPEDFWIKAPKKGIVIFALPREPGLAEVAGGFKIHFHDRQGDFYWSATFLFSLLLNGMDSESADSSLQPDDVETSTEKTTLMLNSRLILRYENSFIGQQCVTFVQRLSY
ncbi:hypothetical protein V6N12_059763 [Hibiscus sabdariffa]|uniref:Peptidase C1A papain C-terminal domain-containing protein n=2 Tax=Hibiscus sabdariffa TaxID=183260 RepID=A0ABR2EW40_9ROSI